ncbi:MAG: adenylyltransferase/cytidyltransferase family protein [Thermomicrobiales bacterium]
MTISLSDLPSLATSLRDEGKTIVLTNGHFDLLHVGHLRYLQAAAGLGDVLIVALNDDAMTTERKGKGRPVLPAVERAELLAGLKCVGYVTIFPQQTAVEVVELVRPDVYVKGGDYGPGGADLPEAAVVERLGGKVAILPFVEGRSTSEIIAAIREGRSLAP